MSPLKATIILRLELTASVVAVKMSLMLNQELDYDKFTETFWSDSQATLACINNESRRFHVFVANRIQFIRTYTNVALGSMCLVY